MQEIGSPGTGQHLHVFLAAEPEVMMTLQNNKNGCLQLMGPIFRHLHITVEITKLIKTFAEKIFTEHLEVPLI